MSAALDKVEDETARSFNKRDVDSDATRKDLQSLKIDMAVVKWMLGLCLL